MNRFLLMFILISFINIWASSIDKVQKDFDMMNYEKAISDGLKILAEKEKPSDIYKLYLLLADSYYKLDKKIPNQSLYYWSLYLSSSPSNKLTKTLIKCYEQWGEKSPKQMISILNLYIPKLRDAGESVERFIYYLGNLYSKIGKKEEANRMYNELIKYYQNEKFKALARKELLKNMIAENHLDEALELMDEMKNTADNRDLKIKILIKKFDYLSAKKIINEELNSSINEQRKKSLNQRLLDINYKTGNYDECLKTLDELIKYSKNDNETGEYLLEKAQIWLNNKKEYLADNTGKYIKTFNNYNKAKEIYNKIISDYEDNDMIYFRAKLGLAKTYIGLFDRNRANDILESIVKDYPDKPVSLEAKRLLERN